MSTAPRDSVRGSLTIAILLTVVLSWVIGSGVTNYLSYLSLRSLHQEMIQHPGVYVRPIPEPRFGIVEFFTGRPPIPRGPIQPAPPRPPGLRPPPPRPPVGEPGGPPPDPSRALFEFRGLLLRLGIALALAILAGAWLGRKFTRPLTQLAKGADAFQSGDFSHRIPARGENEFAAVAAAMNQMAERVSDQISRLESDAERRRQFLADMAHELRGPVTTMETMAGALKDGVASEPDRRDFAVSALADTSQRLRRLVQDLMELARLDLTELPLNVSEVDLRAIASSVVTSHQAGAEAAGITLHPVASPGPVRAVVDPDRIAQVLDNIVGNAISHAGEGAELRVSLEDGDPIRIVISDTGKGIRATDLPYVLDPFYRADAARTPNDCHSGLGLSIANGLVKAHGGTMTLTSKEGSGTTVSITVPKRSG